VVALLAEKMFRSYNSSLLIQQTNISLYFIEFSKVYFLVTETYF